MCKAVEDLKNEFKAEGKAEGRVEGELSMLVTLAKDGIIDISTAAEKANMTVDEFEKYMKTIIKTL